MAKFEIRKDDRSRIHLPKEIDEVLAGDGIEAIANAKTVLLFPAGTDYNTIKESLKIIMADIELRERVEK